MRNNFIYILATISAVLISCALPAPVVEQQTFVPNKELQVVKLTNEGLRLASNSRFAEAEMAFRKALYLSPKTLPVRLNLGIALREQGQYLESELILKELEKEFKESPAIQASLGTLYFNENNLELADSHYQKAIKLALAQKNYELASNYSTSLASAWYLKGYLDNALCAQAYANNIYSSISNFEIYTKLLLERGNLKLVADLSELDQSAGKLGIPIKINQSLALLGLKEYERTLKLLGRLELSVKRRPELLPEIQFLRMLATILNSAYKNGTAPSISVLKDEKEQESFRTLAAGALLQTERVRAWSYESKQVVEDLITSL